MPPQRAEKQCNLLTTFLLHVCASQSRFQLITSVLGRYRKMPDFALSRRQRGFESRWGYKIKRPLTRSDTATSQPACPWLCRQGRGRDAGPLWLSPPALIHTQRHVRRQIGVSARGLSVRRGLASSGARQARLKYPATPLLDARRAS